MNSGIAGPGMFEFGTEHMESSYESTMDTCMDDMTDMAAGCMLHPDYKMLRLEVLGWVRKLMNPSLLNLVLRVVDSMNLSLLNLVLRAVDSVLNYM